MAQNDAILRQLRAIVDAGGPTRPVASPHPGPTGTIRANTGLDRLPELPSSDEPLAQSNPIDGIFGRGALDMVADPSNIAPGGGAVDAVSMFANKGLREAATNLFRTNSAKLPGSLPQAAEAFADQYPRIAAHTNITPEVDPYAGKFGMVMRPPPGGKVTKPVDVGFGESVPMMPDDVTKNMVFHEGTHVAQALGNKDMNKLYDLVNDITGYRKNPFEVSARYSGKKAATEPGIASPGRPPKTIEKLKKLSQVNSHGLPVLNTEASTHWSNDKFYKATKAMREMKAILKRRESMSSGLFQDLSGQTAKPRQARFKGFELPDGKIALPDVEGNHQIVDRPPSFGRKPTGQVNRESGFAPAVTDPAHLPDVAVPIADSLDTAATPKLPLTGRHSGVTQDPLKSRRAKVTRDDIMMIRNLYSLGWGPSDIQAYKFGHLDSSTISEIARNLIYTKVK